MTSPWAEPLRVVLGWVRGRQELAEGRHLSSPVPLTLTGLLFLRAVVARPGEVRCGGQCSGLAGCCLHCVVLLSFSRFPVLARSLLTCFLKALPSLESLPAASLSFPLLFLEPVDMARGFSLLRPPPDFSASGPALFIGVSPGPGLSYSP